MIKTNTHKPSPITPTQYRTLQEAYDFFNKELFSGSLPQVLVTFQRRSKMGGYFSPDRFTGRIQDAAAHELALNPDTFTGRTDEEILAILVHEMVHVWQQAEGTPGCDIYHNREWATKMKEIGLQPTDTGDPGGKETGRKMTHFILQDGKYSKAYAQLEERGFQLQWQSARTGRNSNKTKFTCPKCKQHAWAKPGAQLGCYACFEARDILIRMLAERKKRLNSFQASL